MLFGLLWYSVSVVEESFYYLDVLVEWICGVDVFMFYVVNLECFVVF